MLKARETAYWMLGAVAVSHLLNDTIQALIPAIYPLLKSAFALTFAQVGLMFACILKTNPVNRSSVGLMGPSALGRGCGAGARSTSARRNGSSPKLFRALPKNTGVCEPARYAA